MQIDEGGESGVDLVLGGGLQVRELRPLRAPRFLHISYDALVIRIVRVREQGDHAGLGNQLGQQLEPLRAQLGCHHAEARDVAARPWTPGGARASSCWRRHWIWLSITIV